VSVAALEARLIDPGKVTLTEHFAVPFAMACVEDARGRPDHCYYVAVSENHRLSRVQKTAETEGAVLDALPKTRVALLVRSDSALVPLTWEALLRPEADGTLMHEYQLPQADREVIAELQIRTPGHLYVFVPDSQQGLLMRWLEMSGILTTLLAFGVVVLISVLFAGWKYLSEKRRKQLEPVMNVPPAPPLSNAPPAPPVSNVPPAPPVIPEQRLEAPAQSSLPPLGTFRSEPAPPSNELANGMRVLVTRGQGESLEATVESLRPGQCLCRFDSGNRAWVVSSQITPL
jgi:hypothetical protein